MKIQALGCGFLVLAVLSVLGAGQGSDCPSGRPFQLTRAVAPVIGQSPLWVTTGREPIAWESPTKGVTVLFVRDRSVPGIATLSGRNRTTGAKARFTKSGLGVGFANDTLRLDEEGAKLKTASADDQARYSFHYIAVWFPDSGCYEIAGRVGRQRPTIYLKVEKRTGK